MTPVRFGHATGAQAARPAPDATAIQALNDIHVLPPSPALPAPDAALRDIARILASTGRPLYPSLVLTATIKDNPHGTQVARVKAGGTTILLPQGQNGPGLILHLTPRGQADEDALSTVAAGKVIRHPRAWRHPR